MAWFITSANPSLVVHCEGGHTIVFRDAEYRTEDPSELAALRADPRVREAHRTEAELPILRRWAICLTTGRLHDVERRRVQCYIPAELVAAANAESGGAVEGWKLYQRRADALRWNHKVKDCKHCAGGSGHDGSGI